MLNFAINYVSIIVATILVIILGFLWYGPLFGKQWMKLAGLDAKKMNKKQMPISMVGMIIGSVLLSVALNVLIVTTAAKTITDAIAVGVFVWLGFLVFTHAGSYLWEQRPIKLFILNTAYSLVSIIIAVLVIVMLP